MRHLLILLSIVAVLTGCQGGDDGIDDKAVSDAQAPLIAAAKRAGGDWAKMPPDDQKLFLDRARGNEAAAKQMAGFMAGGAPGGPSKR